MESLYLVEHLAGVASEIKLTITLSALSLFKISFTLTRAFAVFHAGCCHRLVAISGEWVDYLRALTISGYRKRRQMVRSFITINGHRSPVGPYPSQRIAPA